MRFGGTVIIGAYKVDKAFGRKLASDNVIKFTVVSVDAFGVGNAAVYFFVNCRKLLVGAVFGFQRFDDKKHKQSCKYKSCNFACAANVSKMF